MKRRKIHPVNAIVTLAIVLLLILGLVANKGNQAQLLPRAQPDDATPLGGLGLHLTLQKLGYTPKIQSAPLRAMPGDAKVWLLLDPETRFSVSEANLLLAWVRKGGILLFCVRPQSYFLGTPAFGVEDDDQSVGIEKLRTSLGVERSEGRQPGENDFLPELSPLALDTLSDYRTGVKAASGSARTLEISAPHLEIAGPPSGSIVRRSVGSGQVFAFPDALLFTNYALSTGDNATLIANFLRLHSPNGAVYFDERSGGTDAPRTAPPTIMTYLTRPPVSYALWQLGVAALLFWAFAGRRLGAAVALLPDAKVTRASQFAGAMGALFAKVGRPQAAAAIIGTRFRQKLAQKLGLSPAESDRVLARRALEIGGIPFEITDRLLLQSRAPAENLGQALRDAQEMERVLRRLDGKE